MLGNTRYVQLVEWKDRIFIKHGCAEFAEANGIDTSDTLIFTYTVYSSMKIAIFGINGCEKPTIHIQ
jgi:hypothetical protein